MFLVKIADIGLATRIIRRPNERHVRMCGTIYPLRGYVSPYRIRRYGH